MKAPDAILVLLPALQRQASSLRFDSRCGLPSLTPDAPEPRWLLTPAA